MFRGLIGNYLSIFHQAVTIEVQKNSRVSSKTACFDDTLLDFCTPMSTVPGSHGVTAGDWSPGTTHSAPQGQGASRPMQATRCHLPRDRPRRPRTTTCGGWARGATTCGGGAGSCACGRRSGGRPPPRRRGMLLPAAAGPGALLPTAARSATTCGGAGSCACGRRSGGRPPRRRGRRGRRR